jgi:hypothetical protein
LFPEAGAAERQRAARQSDKAALLQALRDEGLLEAQGEVELDELVHAAHAFLGRSASALVMVQLDDLTDEVEQVNVPATSEQHPNWRRRLSLTLHELAGSTRLSDIATLLAVERSGECLGVKWGAELVVGVVKETIYIAAVGSGRRVVHDLTCVRWLLTGCPRTDTARPERECSVAIATSIELLVPMQSYVDEVGCDVVEEWPTIRCLGHHQPDAISPQ